MKEILIKKTILIVIMLLLFIPLIQYSLILFKESPLQGDYKLAEKPDSLAHDWFSGEYQIQYEKYFNDKMGFRSFFVRIYNQTLYTLFNQSSTNNVIIGKQNYLFEKDYIKAYFGDDFNGEKNIKATVDKLKAIQDTLAKLNKNLFVVFAAGKASFYPEYIPDELKKEKKITNNEYYVKLFKENRINFIDINQWFINIKQSSQYPLFPKTGIHWSSYGVALAGDTIVKYIEHLCKTDLPEFYWDNIEVSDRTRNNDADIENAMNLFFKIPNSEMAYPNIKYKNLEKKKLNCIVVSDSYYWQLFNYGFSSNLFNRGKFWYYNKLIYPDSYKKPSNVLNINLEDEINKTDLFVVISTECNTGNIGWEFIANIYDYFYNHEKNGILEKKIKKFKNNINMTRDWLAKVRKKALDRNIPLDSMIYLDALYMAKIELAKEQKIKE